GKIKRGSELALSDPLAAPSSQGTNPARPPPATARPLSGAVNEPSNHRSEMSLVRLLSEEPQEPPGVPLLVLRGLDRRSRGLNQIFGRRRHPPRPFSLHSRRFRAKAHPDDPSFRRPEPGHQLHIDPRHY